MSIIKQIQERRKALLEGNKDNKVKKNLHTIKVGHKQSVEHLMDKYKGARSDLDGATFHHLKRQQSGSSSRHYNQQTIARHKQDGRKHMRGEFLHQKEEVEQTVDQIEEEIEISPIMETIIDLLEQGQNILKKRGRPKKDRHEDGKIVND